MKNLSALFTDFYELTMAQGYWKKGINDTVVFDYFFRKQPFNGGFSVFAGLAPLLEAISSLKFSEEDISYLRSLKVFEEDFLTLLKDFKFTGDIYSFEEGSVIFPQEPVLRVHANIIEAQILEGIILNQLNFASLIATKTARVLLASNMGNIMEFGLRRAQGFDGSLSATRSAFIGGASSTSNTLASKLYDMPVSGTMAHSWVMSFTTEEESFREFANLYPNHPVFLLDTYDTLKSGIKNAITIGKELKEKGINFGVRLDSGDIAYLSKEVRKELDEAGLKEATISVSNELTEEIISALINEKAPIDSYGVGTHLVTGGSESSFSGIYKLAARKKKSTDQIIPTMKFSDNPSKTTIPGIKNVWRLYDREGFARADIIALENETLESNKEYKYYHPMGDYRCFSFSANKVVLMLRQVMKNGEVISKASNTKEEILKGKETLLSQLKTLDASYKRILNPHIYKVSMTENLKELKFAYLRANQNE